jgi:2-dehydro-3-deoxyglucarate aldolase
MSFLWLDAEYTGLTANEVATVVRHTRARDIDVLVRVPSFDPNTVITFSNTGVSEIVLPRIRTESDVIDAWAAMNYAPIGARPRQVVPASAWGLSYGHVPRISVIIETLDAVRLFSTLVEFDWISSFWLGHKDLADDYRRQGGTAEGLSSMTADAVGALRESHVQFGWGVADPDEIQSVWLSGATRCALYWDLHLSHYLGKVAENSAPEVRSS